MKVINNHLKRRPPRYTARNRDLKKAVKYGKREIYENPKGLFWKYTYDNVVYITDLKKSKKIIAAWSIPGNDIDLQKMDITEMAQEEHNRACQRILSNTAMWTSHVVIVVDQSGSMRKADVEGGTTRSDAVWLTLAMDFVAKQLIDRKASNTDVVSIVELGMNGYILVDRKPHDWILFNTVIDLLRKQRPTFHGNYLPALDTAEKLLLSNDCGRCALSLFVLSDGKPSDRIPQGFCQANDTQTARETYLKLIGNRIDSLASRFGRRLSVVTVGFANDGEDFSVLQSLANRSKQYGSNSKFFAASLNPQALGKAFSTVSSSLNQTRSELSAIGTSSQRKVRDVRRKALNSVGKDLYPGKDWFTYFSSNGGWDSSRLIYSNSHIAGKKDFVPIPPIHFAAAGVAVSNLYFGEGAERLVREFRELDEYGMFIGPKLVAKESRFQMDVWKSGYADIKEFHKKFCDTQYRAQRLAKIFNKRLEQLPCYDPQTMPKISFLDCSVYMVNDEDKGTIGMLVEKQLDPTKYHKWNDNRGAVEGVNIGQVVQRTGMVLDIIEEGDEEEYSCISYDDSVKRIEDVCQNILPKDIPQAFSHFTYKYTNEKMLVCDLQGVVSDTNPPVFELTDPVIHFRSRHGYKHVFGRTDLGSKGMRGFFRTHKCSPLCKMLFKRWVPGVRLDEYQTHLDVLEEPRVSNIFL